MEQLECKNESKKAFQKIVDYHKLSKIEYVIEY